MTKTGRKKLLPRHHTGKVRPHKHTSYSALAMVLVMFAVPLFAISNTLVSAAPEDPVTAEYGTYAVVEGQAPTVAPVFTNVVNGRVFKDIEALPLRGTCPANTLVKVFKNEVFAGAALCQNGTFNFRLTCS